MRLGPLNAIHRRADGDTPPVVLLHGIGLGAWLWERDQELLAERGYSSWALDLPGHGEDTRDVRLDNCIQGVVQALAELDRPAVLVGHSFGGLVAQAVAAQVEVSHLVLIAPFPCAEVRFFPNMVGARVFAPLLPSLVAGRPLQPGRQAYVETGLHLLPEAEQERFLQKLGPWPNGLVRDLIRRPPSVPSKAISAPILILHGFQDRAGSLYSSRLLCDHYNCVMWRFDDLAHLPQVEPGGERLTSAWIDWVEKPVGRKVQEVEAFRPDEGVGSDKRIDRNPNPERSDSKFGKRYKGGRIRRRKEV